MKAIIKKSRAEGVIDAPPSKSMAHRLLICAALANGKSRIDNISLSEDIAATVGCLEKLGAVCEYAHGAVNITGAFPQKLENVDFPCRESGSTLRFLIPVALAFGGSFSFSGTERLIERGIGIYEKLFAQKGILIKKNGTSVSFEGKLSAGEFELRGDVSSQFVSGLLFALPLLEHDSVIRLIPPVESRPYINITLETLKKFGIEINADGDTFYVRGNQKYLPQSLENEGDWSNTAALLAFNMLGGDVTVKRISSESLQGDRVCAELFEKLSAGFTTADISDCPDLAPILFAVAASKHGGTFTGTRRLKIKESDRASVMAAEMQKFGIITDVDENSVTVHAGKISAPTAELDAHNDHRIVMALTFLASICGGTVNGAEAVNKSFPDFWKKISALGIEVTYD